jgi:CheY-like chemotaxis protein
MRKEDQPVVPAPRPDLILLDLKMPGQSGLEFLTTMKQDQRLCAIPVVVITTSTLNADVFASYQCGAAGYLNKPTDINEFIAAIRKLCQYWFELVRLPENLQ